MTSIVQRNGAVVRRECDLSDHYAVFISTSEWNNDQISANYNKYQQNMLRCYIWILHLNMIFNVEILFFCASNVKLLQFGRFFGRNYGKVRSANVNFETLHALYTPRLHRRYWRKEQEVSKSITFSDERELASCSKSGKTPKKLFYSRMRPKTGNGLKNKF